MGEFSGWVDMAIKFWLAVIAFFLGVTLLGLVLYHFFGWTGPVALVGIWFLAGFLYDKLPSRKK